MVTAGVYLIARTHGPVPDDAGSSCIWWALLGAVTLLLAGFAALVQTDIKRVLAYSTMSQIGYIVPRAWRAGMGCGDFPLDDSRVL